MSDRYNRCANDGCNLLSVTDDYCVACREYDAADKTPNFLVGQWLWLHPRPWHAEKMTPRKVTFIGVDSHGYSLFAEGWVNVRAVETERLTDLIGRCKHGYEECRPAALCHGCCIDLIESTK